MTRVIKFRGKSKKTGKWLVGDLIHEDGKVYILPINELYIGTRDRKSDFDVDENTVGEFTGLKDNHDNELYEGDIVDFLNSVIQGSRLVNMQQKIGTIAPDEYNRSSILCNDEDGEERVYHIENAVKYGYVIGNIHDNPELLEE